LTRTESASSFSQCVSTYIPNPPPRHRFPGDPRSVAVAGDHPDGHAWGKPAADTAVHHRNPPFQYQTATCAPTYIKANATPAHPMGAILSSSLNSSSITRSTRPRRRAGAATNRSRSGWFTTDELGRLAAPIATPPFRQHLLPNPQHQRYRSLYLRLVQRLPLLFGQWLGVGQPQPAANFCGLFRRQRNKPHA